MKTMKTNEVNLIRSRALTAMFSLILSALLLFPLLTSAKGEVKPESNGKVYMHAFSNKPFATVSVSDFEATKYMVSIEDASGAEVYSTVIKDAPANYSKVFDFSKLEDGIYTLKVNANGNLKVRHFVLKNGEIKVKYEEKDQPTFKTAGTKAFLSYPNTLSENVNINVYSATGEILYSSTESDESITKVFDFSKMHSGNYKVVLSSKVGDYAFNYQN